MGYKYVAKSRANGFEWPSLQDSTIVFLRPVVIKIFMLKNQDGNLKSFTKNSSLKFPEPSQSHRT